MRILIVAATEFEVGGLRSEVGSRKSENLEIEFLITGVGMVATSFAMGKHLANNEYNLILNLGIAGSFDRNIALGEVVQVSQDTFAELGAEDDIEFLTIDQLGFGESTYYSCDSLPNTHSSGIANLKQVKAITVNKVHGNESSIETIKKRLNPQLESMEGAAFFYACVASGNLGLQIRAVSNYVEKRNRDAWQIGLAIKNLNTFALDFLKIFWEGGVRTRTKTISVTVYPPPTPRNPQP
jgi:futalosine hydrolase